MINGAASGKTAGEMPAVLLQLPHTAFLPGVLVPADYHRAPVLPQEKDTFAFPHVPGEQFFGRQIPVGIRAVRSDLLKR